MTTKVTMADDDEVTRAAFPDDELEPSDGAPPRGERWRARASSPAL
jgi:hypothetical protein